MSHGPYSSQVQIAKGMGKEPPLKDAAPLKRGQASCAFCLAMGLLSRLLLCNYYICIWLFSQTLKVAYIIPLFSFFFLILTTVFWGRLGGGKETPMSVSSKLDD